MQGLGMVHYNHSPFGELDEGLYKVAVYDIEKAIMRCDSRVTPLPTVRKIAMILASKGVQSAAMMTDVTQHEAEDWLPEGILRALTNGTIQRLIREADRRERLAILEREVEMHRQFRKTCSAKEVAKMLTPKVL